MQNILLDMSDDANQSDDTNQSDDASQDELTSDAVARESGPLLDFERGEELEAYDRKHAGPGGEPPCPACQTQMLRAVEKHRAPRSDESPFRVRLTCPSADCGVWTGYNW